MSKAQMPTAIMSSQVNGLALFTVEQIELVRRLRNSGITKEQIIQAFEAMDRLDRELGPVYSLPVTLVSFGSCQMLTSAAN
ncbi:hypothetical protein LSH36_552g01051 [Paralvinella palmiformis]|uniref:HNF-p1 domain-containing protein n=1 Tax=Paralvinella palmiformis TaxID=53620 RepID=A0AAD9J7A1_9ANNE|nr:hypothetical protein LSH36_552g01051 [Paralvinella palmiformis]